MVDRVCVSGRAGGRVLRAHAPLAQAPPARALDRDGRAGLRLVRAHRVGAHEDAVVGRARPEVARPGHLAVVVPLGPVELDADPVPVLELRGADEAHRAGVLLVVVEHHARADFALGAERRVVRAGLKIVNTTWAK